MKRREKENMMTEKISISLFGAPPHFVAPAPPWQASLLLQWHGDVYELAAVAAAIEGGAYG
jgi:hypothetical protein